MGANPIVVNATTLYQLSPIAPKWIETLVKHLTTRVIPEKMSKKQQRYLEKYVEEFSIIANQLYHRGKGGNLRICVIESDYKLVLTHAHSYAFGGHFSADVTTKAKMRAKLWWPMLHKDDVEFFKQCNKCQRYTAPIRKDKMPLRPTMGACAFAKWEIDFVKTIDPLATCTLAQYIIVA